ncbi:nuclear transport factor 2 family protein [Streptomyces albipurpureus]|uniref:Nuclear transport factor 2 family protein n=1 Tax=Streptomyces albipurpureus TaxID=2897419 RepID=A0ABT0UM41_9ACTN|nr:nuclear transport factor 2 family protein [Streptomyces sp. CWNU-1]MCM2389683.1 nuclear transport factor 2 family protein [Streptomyces sp. CWNU-1]
MTDTGLPQSPRAIADAYFKRMDAGQDFLDLFADDAYVVFPKHAPARGIEEVRGLFGDIFVLFTSVVHEIAYFNHISQGDLLVVEGTTHGVLADGTKWRATEGLGGRFCNVFEIRDGKIHRLHIYLDPDYGDADTARYPWLSAA